MTNRDTADAKKRRLKYQCPSCQAKSYSKEWNAATNKRYGTNGEICPIQLEENNSYHLCPGCGVQSEMFKGVLIIDPTESTQAKPEAVSGLGQGEDNHEAPQTNQIEQASRQ